MRGNGKLKAEKRSAGLSYIKHRQHKLSSLMILEL